MQLDSVIAMEDMVVRLVLVIGMVGAGVLLNWSARAVASGRLKRNQITGIRTSRSLSSGAAWQTAHARAERPTVLAGVVTASTGIISLSPVQIEVVGAAVPAGSAMVLVLMLYGARVGLQTARHGPEGD